MCNCKSNQCGCNSKGIPKGPKGDPGSPGNDGNSVLNGTSAPNSDTGDIGDFYIDTENNEIYGPKTEEGWGEPTSLTGPQGPPGEDCECAVDTGWMELEGFNHMEALDLPRPEARRIGEVIYFRGNILIPLASDAGGSSLVVASNDLYVSDQYAYVFQGPSNQGGVTVDSANGYLFFNANTSIIPAGLISGIIDSDRSLKNIIITRKIETGTNKLTVLSAAVDVILKSTGILQVSTLKALESDSSVLPTNVGSNPLRFITSYVKNNYYNVDLTDIQSTVSGSTLHSSEDPTQYDYTGIQTGTTVDDTFKFDVDASQPNNLGGFIINIDGLTALQGPIP